MAEVDPLGDSGRRACTHLSIRPSVFVGLTDELNTHAENSEDVRLDQATRDYHLGACWAWYLHLSPHPGIAKHPDSSAALQSCSQYVHRKKLPQ
eukprot:scaffold41631_cov68-Phaeocystis_antarctica.AAC.1